MVVVEGGVDVKFCTFVGGGVSKMKLVWTSAERSPSFG